MSQHRGYQSLSPPVCFSLHGIPRCSRQPPRDGHGRVQAGGGGGRWVVSEGGKKDPQRVVTAHTVRQKQNVPLKSYPTRCDTHRAANLSTITAGEKERHDGANGPPHKRGLIIGRRRSAVSSHALRRLQPNHSSFHLFPPAWMRLSRNSLAVLRCFHRP